MDILSNIISCIGLESLIAGLIGLTTFARTRKELFLFFFIILSEITLTRAFLLKDCSSRYFAQLILPALFFSSIFIGSLLKKRKLYRFLFVLLLLCVTVFQFISFNNVYIKDLQIDYQEITRQKRESAIVIDYREITRIALEKNQYIFLSERVNDLKNEKALNDVTESFNGWNKPSYFFLKVTKDFENASIKKHGDMKVIRSYSADKNNKKRFVVLKRTPGLMNENKNKVSEIINGDFEKLLSKSDTDKKMMIWTKNSNQSDQLLPEHSLLGEFKKEFINLPVIYADNENAITGKTSLHVKTKDETTIYFLNTVAPSSGELGFKIKLLSGPQVMSIQRRYYYDDKTTRLESKDFYFLIDKNNTTNICIRFNEYDNKAKEMLFCLKCSDCEFLLDDIAFYKETDKTND